MKSVLNNLRLAAWRGLEPIRRPFVRRLDDHVDARVKALLAAELEDRLVPTLSAALESTERSVARVDDLIANADRAAEETNQALSGLLAELLRLREQVEALQRVVRPGEPGQDRESLDGVAFDGSDSECEPFPADSADERARVG
jgi:hypothetical protein